MLAEDFEAGAPAALGPLRLGADEAPACTVASARRRRPTSVSAISKSTLAWGVGGVKPAPPLALRRLTAPGAPRMIRSTTRDPAGLEPSSRGANPPLPVRGETAMGTSRRQFFQVTAGGLVAASGVVGRVRPVAAQGPTVKIGTAVLGDFSMVAPIVVAQEKGFFRGQGVAVEFQPFRGGPDLVKAVVAGQLQIGVTGATDVPVFRATGVPIRFIASQVDGNHFTLNVAADDQRARRPQGQVDRRDPGRRRHLDLRRDAREAAGLGPGEGRDRRGTRRARRPAGGAHPRRDRRVHLGGRRGRDGAPGQVEGPAPARHRHAEVDQPGVLRDRRIHQGQQGRAAQDVEGALPGGAVHPREPRGGGGHREQDAPVARGGDRAGPEDLGAAPLQGRGAECRGPRGDADDAPRVQGSRKSGSRRPTSTRRSSRPSGCSGARPIRAR